MPDILIVAGPNGAGKTTFAREYLATEQRHFEFVNADEIAQDLDQPSDMLAGRVMLDHIDRLVAARSDFMIETTLATLGYARKIPAWREQGYFVSLVYVRLDSVEQSIARVRKRVAAGGHGIPEAAIIRRFARSWNYFESIYQPIVDEWYVWASREGGFSLINSWDGRHAPRP